MDERTLALKLNSGDFSLAPCPTVDLGSELGRMLVNSVPPKSALSLSFDRTNSVQVLSLGLPAVLVKNEMALLGFGKTTSVARGAASMTVIDLLPIAVWYALLQKNPGTVKDEANLKSFEDLLIS